MSGADAPAILPLAGIVASGTSTMAEALARHHAGALRARARHRMIAP